MLVANDLMAMGVLHALEQTGGSLRSSASTARPSSAAIRAGRHGER
jgi:hypothetical protein